MYKKYIKRILDIIISLISITLLLPILIIISLLVLLFMGKPILFKQERPGKDERIFTMYKFRSMNNKKDKHGNLLPDEKRITKFGRFVRSTSMDELPEIFNILKGDMSFVGPRPLLKEYLPYYTKEEKRRHSLRPGLTGWAQINGRNVTDWPERLQQDIYYVDNCHFLFDCKIIFLTILKVIKRSDILVGNEISAGRLDVTRSKKR